MGWVMIRLEFCTPGVVRGPLPELRLGLLRLAWCPGEIADRLEHYEHQLSLAAVALRAVRT